MANLFENTLDVKRAEEYDTSIKAVFCVTVSVKNNVRKDIDNIFNKDKVRYMTAYKNSSMFDNPLIMGESIDIIRYTEKLAGILEVSISSNNYDDLYKISKKAFTKIHSNVKNKSNLTFYDVFRYSEKTVQGNEDAVASFYLYFLLGRVADISTDNMNNILQILNQRCILALYKRINFSEENMNLNKGFINKEREYFGIQKGSYTVRELMTLVYKKDILRYNSENILYPHKQLNPTDIHRIESIGSVSKYAGGIEGLFKYLGTNTERLFAKTTLTNSEIDELIVTIMYCNKFNSFNEDDKGLYFIASIYFYVLNKEYKNTKSQYLKDFNEEYLIELDSLQKKLMENNSEAKRTKELYEQKTKAIEESNEKLLEELEKYKREVKRLEEKNKENEEAKIENIKLRNFVFNNNLEDVQDIEEDEISKEDIDILNNKKVVILGGSTPWVNKMKEKLPNVIFANLDTKYSNLEFINKNSIIFINTNMKHAFYYKIKSITSKLNLEYNYVHNYTNIDQSLKDMVKILKDEGNN